MKLCIIGGGSGIGLGLATAARARDAEVTVVGRSRTKLEASGFPYVIADATREADVAALFAHPRFEHVVLTTVSPYYGLVAELEVAEARACIDAKLMAALLVAKHAKGLASLTVTSGINALRPAPRGAVLAATNGALDALVRALAVELAPMRVNAISPGWVDTPVWEHIAGAKKREVLDAQAARLPVGRTGTPADLAEAYLMVMTNGYITGQTLHVDGGHQLV